MKKQKFPPGWNEKRVKEVIAHYENQTEDEEYAEIKAALKAENITLMDIPTELVPKVRALLAPASGARKGRGCGGRTMIANDQELQITLDRIAWFHKQAAYLRKTETNPSSYRAFCFGLSGRNRPDATRSPGVPKCPSDRPRLGPPKMKSIADLLPPDIARQIHPDWRKNEADYWAMRDQLLRQYQGKWIGFADGVAIASGTSPVEVFHAALDATEHPFVTCVGREEEPCRIRPRTFRRDVVNP